jgi:hypothetical protein
MWEFAKEHPVAFFFIAFFAMFLIADMVESISKIFY